MASRTADSAVLPDHSFFDGNMPGGSSHGPPQIFNISTKLIRGCAAPGCSKKNDLSRCSACKVVQYCGRDHQFADRAAHRSACSKTKKAAAILEQEKRNLTRDEGEEIFEEERGHFWGKRSLPAQSRALC